MQEEKAENGVKKDREDWEKRKQGVRRAAEEHGGRKELKRIEKDAASRRRCGLQQEKRQKAATRKHFQAAILTKQEARAKFATSISALIRKRMAAEKNRSIMASLGGRGRDDQKFPPSK